MTPDKIIQIARLFLFVREAQQLGQNRGLRVESIQHWSAGQYGDSWCAEFVWFVFDIACSGSSPLPRTGSSELMRAACEQWKVDVPEPGDLYFYLDSFGRAHHVGIVTVADPLTGLAGNTSEDGRSSNGDRVAEHQISASYFVRVPLPTTVQ